jgi:hypothetical protein
MGRTQHLPPISSSEHRLEKLSHEKTPPSGGVFSLKMQVWVAREAWTLEA